MLRRLALAGQQAQRICGTRQPLSLEAVSVALREPQRCQPALCATLLTAASPAPVTSSLSTCGSASATTAAGVGPACTSHVAGLHTARSSSGSKATNGSGAVNYGPLRHLLLGLAGTAAVGLGLHALQPASSPQCEAAGKSEVAKAKKDTSKVYSKEEVAKHNSKDKGIWVTYQGKVYDVTDWVDVHPGGSQRLMLAAGGPLEPFWAMYQQHNQPAVRNILQQYEIGQLEGGAGASQPVEDPYKDDPARHPILLVRSAKPYNAETPVDILAEHLITPNDFFYVRNHLPVPHVDVASYTLKVEGEGLRALQLTYDDLRTKFKKHSILATLQCSGNRRDDMAQVKPIKGLEWDVGAIGTAVWGGVRLRDVLREAGMTEDAIDSEVRHIQFEGLDHDASGTHYGASIPIEKALNPAGDVLLAYEMNGSPLPADHGFPVRVVVPGVTGARSVKWLDRIVSSKVESDSHWQQKDYKAFSPSVDWDNVDWSSAPALQETNVQSAITEPKAGAKVDAGMDLPIKGYAFSGGGRPIIRVDVSADGGKTWTTADLQRDEKQQSNRAWGWTLWRAEVPIPDESKGPIQLTAKATDMSYNTQPESPGPIWNLRGVVNNAWHKVKVDAE